MAFPEFFHVERRRERARLQRPSFKTLKRLTPGNQLLGVDYLTHRRVTYLTYLLKGSELRTVSHIQ